MIKDLKKRYINGEKRLSFGKDLFEAEKELFDFQWMMHQNPCKRITISEKDVVATFDMFGKEVSMALDLVDFSAVPAQILIKGYYEKEETDMVMKLINMLDNAPVILDVGANLGWYGINIKKQLPQSTVYFFEPVPDTVKRLKRNIELNELDKCYVFNEGLFDRDTEMMFYYDVTESGASSMADLREKETTKHMPVKMGKMDDFISREKVSKIDFIKCDVEGSELFVYKGGKEAIEKYKPIVFSEMLRKWAAKFSYHPNDIIDFFGEMGYGCFIIDNGCLKTFDRVTEETIETNYFFLHKEKHASIINALERK